MNKIKNKITWVSALHMVSSIGVGMNDERLQNYPSNMEEMPRGVLTVGGKKIEGVIFEGSLASDVVREIENKQSIPIWQIRLLWDDKELCRMYKIPPNAQLTMVRDSSLAAFGRFYCRSNISSYRVEIYRERSDSLRICIGNTYSKLVGQYVFKFPADVIHELMNAYDDDQLATTRSNEHPLILKIDELRKSTKAKIAFYNIDIDGRSRDEFGLKLVASSNDDGSGMPSDFIIKLLETLGEYTTTS